MTIGVTMFKFTLILQILAIGLITISRASPQIQYEWNYLNFTWPSSLAYEQALQDGSYIPENNIITGVKTWRDRVYLTLPRWRRGVPATLVVTSAVSSGGEKSPLLEPYPSWEAQRLDDCSALQYVQSMEIDPLGRMWVLENGRTEFLEPTPRTKCPPRLIILDLANDGAVLMDYAFPRDVVRPESAFLNDIVLDHEGGGWAYISDTDNVFPGIVVFSLRDKTSWKVTHPTMNPKDEASNFVVNGTLFSTSGPVDGIALSPAITQGNRVVYYTPLSSFELFSVPVWALKLRQVDNHVTLVGRKSSQTDGMTVDAIGRLYYGLVTKDAVLAWDTNAPFDFSSEQKVVVLDADTNQWPDTFGIDEEARLWWTSNRIQRFMTGQVNLDEPNYRVIFARTSARSYQYYPDGSSPILPDILP